MKIKRGGAGARKRLKKIEKQDKWNNRRYLLKYKEGFNRLRM